MVYQKENLLLFLFLFCCMLMQGQTLLSWYEVKEMRFGKEITYKDKRKDSLLNGHYKLAYSSGSYSELHFLNGKVDGIRTEYDGLGYKLSETNFDKGNLNGSSIQFYQNGKVMEEAYYKEGEADGTWKTYNDNGRIVITENYKAGKKEGKWVREIKYPQNNTTRVETSYFKNDQPIGKWESRIKNGNLVRQIEYKSAKNYVKKEYYSNGEINRIETYKDNTLNGPYKKYFSNGIKKLEGSFKNGFRSGIWKEFTDKKATIKSEVSYVNGEKEGLSKYYNQAKRLSETGKYINNRKEGLWKYYDLAGDLERETEYENGFMVSEKKYK